jgi:hypothetical protein
LHEVPFSAITAYKLHEIYWRSLQIGEGASVCLKDSLMETTLISSVATFFTGIGTAWLVQRGQKRSQEATEISNLWAENRKLHEDLNNAWTTIRDLQQQVLRLEKQLGAKAP